MSELQIRQALVDLARFAKAQHLTNNDLWAHAIEGSLEVADEVERTTPDVI